MERCDGHRGGVRGWRGVMVIREVFGGMGRCGSSQRGVKVVRNWFQLLERYDGHGEDVRVCGKV